jgi:hypothetical protein
MITANSFMKREFGKVLIETFLSRLNVELIVNTSGAYIPGHGTPTVLLFGTQERAIGSDALVVLANRGEPTTPDLPEKGAVWSAIAAHWNDQGFENEYISVARIARSTLGKHPWSLGGGGAADLKELLEERAPCRLSDVISDVGFSVIIGEDEVFIRPASTLRWLALPTIPLVIGENVRDWSLSTPESILRPFHPETLEVVPTADLLKELWPWKRILETRVVSGSTTMKESGREWFDVRRLSRDKHKLLLSITFAFVATHNHFVLDRGGKVFKQSAPIIKLPETATEDDHLALLAYLNSSVAGFYFRQVLHSKGAQGVNEGHKSEEWEQFLEYSGTQVATIPLPRDWQTLAPLGRVMLKLVDALLGSMPRAHVSEWRAHHGRPLAADFGTLPSDVQRRLVAMQEEIDWKVYDLFGLLALDEGSETKKLSQHLLGDIESLDCRASSPFPAELAAGHRPFELRMKGQSTQWFHRNGYAEGDSADAYAQPVASLLRARMRAIQGSRELQILEQPQYKRRWTLPDVSGEAATQVHAWASDRLEAAFGVGAAPAATLAMAWLRLEPVRAPDALRFYLGADALSWCRETLKSESVPFLAAFRHTETGIEKRSIWEATWALQRLEDAGEGKVSGNSIAPPKYDQKDFREPSYFALRGKLDVPKERFISYPGCESDEDKEPVYGWAGWDHLQRAVALAGLYQDRKQREGWDKERLKPMLAGLLELLPWLKQWHNEPSEELGGERPSDQFEAFLNAECSELGFTHDDLRAWRPAAKTRGTGKRKNKKPAPASESDIADSETAS